MIIYSEFSHWKWWIFPSFFVNVYQRVNLPAPWVADGYAMDAMDLSGRFHRGVPGPPVGRLVGECQRSLRCVAFMGSSWDLTWFNQEKWWLNGIQWGLMGM